MRRTNLGGRAGIHGPMEPAFASADRNAPPLFRLTRIETEGRHGKALPALAMFGCRNSKVFRRGPVFGKEERLWDFSGASSNRGPP